MDGTVRGGRDLARICASIELNLAAWRTHRFVDCDCKAGPCDNTPPDALPGLGTLNTCPAALIRAPAWRAAVTMADWPEIAPIDGLWSRWSAQVAWGVLEMRAALVQRALENARE